MYGLSVIGCVVTQGLRNLSSFARSLGKLGGQKIKYRPDAPTGLQLAVSDEPDFDRKWVEAR